MDVRHLSVEAVTERISALVRERQDLRAAGAGDAELERNRLELARAQHELSRLLIARHLASPAV